MGFTFYSLYLNTQLLTTYKTNVYLSNNYYKVIVRLNTDYKMYIFFKVFYLDTCK